VPVARNLGGTFTRIGPRNLVGKNSTVPEERLQHLLGACGGEGPDESMSRLKERIDKMNQANQGGNRGKKKH